MTRMIMAMHRLLKTKEDLTELLAKLLKETGETQIVDLCSGSGGPMPDVAKELKHNHGFDSLKLTLTDLYPNHKAAEIFNQEKEGVSYHEDAVDATDVSDELKGLRTMICSFHHMKKEAARGILESAFEKKQPICIFEISDNSMPLAVAWLAFPINIITAFVATILTRPLTLFHILFTIIPVIPICFAWDGAISNMRTYTHKDLDILLEGLQSEDYTWEKDTLSGQAKKMYLIGKPV